MPAGCPPESNPYPYPYPYPDSNPKFESGSVTNPYPIQAPGACAEERPRAGEQSLRHSLRCDTSLYSREAIDGAIPEDGVRPLAGESPRPASALPSEGAQEAPREAENPAQGNACSSSGVPGIEKPPANASKEEYHAYLVRLQEHFAREDAAAAAERARQAAEHVPERRVPEFVRERLKQLRAQEAARRARERAESEARYRKALAAWLGDASAEKAECCA